MHSKMAQDRLSFASGASTSPWKAQALHLPTDPVID